jgi:hypothetical protein
VTRREWLLIGLVLVPVMLWWYLWCSVTPIRHRHLSEWLDPMWWIEAALPVSFLVSFVADFGPRFLRLWREAFAPAQPAGGGAPPGCPPQVKQAQT